MSLVSAEVTQQITSNGFWAQEDAAVGKRVDDIVNQGFQFKTEQGLELCKVTALDDPRIRPVIEFFLPRSVLGFYKAYGRTRQVHCILNRLTPELQILVVQIWSSGSEVIFYPGSHTHLLNAVGAQNGLLAIPPDRLNLPGINAKSVEMPNGGFAIVDARLAFRPLGGKVVMFGFMTPSEVIYWAKMGLPGTLEQKVRDEMESQTIGMNFKFQRSEGDGADDGPSLHRQA
ncbi:hypothetical protein C8A05DRAFT_17539 [Staphylotrichum tortipilum]|uniref:Uncharacterized protein n=1 Tax=Staphylotrichum tortipilum TaxID=2831512 RepID=A0AAN6MH91_9PEZI|nr:hypothetical protein C8A05DRAFT_17539 [Staphylotrichum longicolle]